MSNSSHSTNSPHQSQSQEISNKTTVSLLAGDSNAFYGYPDSHKTELLTLTSPDAYLVTDTVTDASEATGIQYQMPEHRPTFYPGSEYTGNTEVRSINGIDIVICAAYEDLEKIRRYEKAETITPSTPTFIFSNLLSLETDLDSLETSLNGIDDYTNHLQPSQLDGSYIHLTGNIKSGYCREWDGLTIRGFGGEKQSTNGFTLLEISPSGYINSNHFDKSMLGLQALEGVGPKTANRLQQNGFKTRDKTANSDISELIAISGIGEDKAQTIKDSADAIERGIIVPQSNKPVPGNDPICIDIETDGLNPSFVWLIGIKDSSSNEYLNFIQTDPSDKGKAVRDFMQWFTATKRDRTIIAWNGWEFDFPVLREHIQRHCPEYLEDWERASKRDPLRWARDFENATLPGRTNKLEDVANALGWDGHNTGLSGAEVARKMQEWMNNPSPETELDWEKHKQYCQDDVEALELIYRELESASRVANTDNQTRIDIENETTQSSLFDSY